MGGNCKVGKYDELCIAYNSSLERFHSYQESCYEFAENFFAEMKRYFGLPANILKFHVVSQNDKALSESSLRKAMQLGEDGFYLLPFSLTLTSGLGDEIVVITIKIKRNDDEFAIKLANLRKEFIIRTDKDYEIVFEYIFDELKFYYDHDGRIFKLSVNPIGFIARQINALS